MVPPREEWEFVTHTARLYGRMGCDLLALDLVRNWEFLPPAKSISTISPLPSALDGTAKTSPVRSRPPSTVVNGFDVNNIDPRKMLRRRSSLVVADLPSPIRANFTTNVEQKEISEKTEERSQPKQPPPTAFQEPDSSSLLDSFGF